MITMKKTGRSRRLKNETGPFSPCCRGKGAFFMALAFLVLATGCAGKGHAPLGEAPPPTPKDLAPLGFSIQIGAFTDVDNAVRLTRSLEERGLDAYYFHYKTGLYKVRFGDFPSKEAARAEAEGLVGAGFVSGYYVVNPEETAAAKARIYGTGHLRKEIVETAESFIGLPYRWGGSSAKEGFDCSGLAMAVYRLNGLNLPRSSREQYRVGAPVGRGDLSKGDLVFFATSRTGKVSHVGVYKGEGRFVHAPGRGKRIREDPLSKAYYAARYLGGRTYLR